MSTIKQSKEDRDRETVMYDFSVEPHHSMKVLNDYIREYPQHEADLRELREILVSPDEDFEKIVLRNAGMLNEQ
jgi:hypothetical protein